MTLYNNFGPGGPFHGNRQASEEVHSSSAQGAINLTGSIPWIPTGWFSLPISFDTTAEPLENSGIKVGEIIGWRIWSISRRRGGKSCAPLLRSYMMDSIWLPDKPMDGMPHDYGMDGVWAFKDMSDAIRKYQESELIGTGLFAMGSVKMWGQIVEHAIGYRSEFARIASIELLSDKNTLEQLREIYKVERTK